jgi:hypothetical protein
MKHDESKFHPPEREPYILLTHLKANNIEPTAEQ